MLGLCVVVPSVTMRYFLNMIQAAQMYSPACTQNTSLCVCTPCAGPHIMCISHQSERGAPHNFPVSPPATG